MDETSITLRVIKARREEQAAWQAWEPHLLHNPDAAAVRREPEAAGAGARHQRALAALADACGALRRHLGSTS